MTPTNLMAAVGDTAYFVHEYPETLQMVVFPERGFSFLTATTGDEQPIAEATGVMEGELLSLTFFKPQDADNWGASFDLSAASIALESGSLTTSQGFTGGSDFNAVVDRLGTNYDVNG